VLVPPRPNLGPVAWEEEGPSFATVAAVWFLLLAALVMTWSWRRRRAALRERRAKLHERARSAVENDALTREPLAFWSVAVREALAARFGPALRARTTEEIAADHLLAEELGPEPFDRLVRFLSVADRVRFAAADPAPPDAGTDEPQGGWETWARDFVASAVPGDAAGAKSRISGK
jgi:hypothetical protein